MRRSSALSVVLLIGVALPTFAQEKKADEPTKADEKKPANEKKPADEKKPAEQRKPAEEKKPTEDKKPLVLGKDGLAEPPPELAKLLEVWVADPEPQRELKRVYASSLYYLLERDLERFILCFHSNFAWHTGNGGIQPMPPSELRALVKKGWAAQPKSTLKLADLIDLKRVRVYSKAEAKASRDEGWKKEPRLIAEVMEDGDFLVIGPTNKAAIGEKASDFEHEVFYVFRKQGAHYRIVLGE